MLNEMAIPLHKAETPSAQFSEIGLTGLKRDTGLVMEEFLEDLKGDKAIQVFSRMSRNDPIVGATLFAIEMLIRQVPWSVSPPGSQQVAGQEAAEFLESCLHDMNIPWRDILSEILSFLIFGWSYHEIVYKIRGGPDETSPMRRSAYKDGRIGWRKWAIRAQESLERWEFDEEGGLKGMWQRPAPDYKLRFIPIEKSLLFRTKHAKGSPEGISILRQAYKPWYLKRQAEIVEAIGIERDLAGLPEIRVPPQWLDSNPSEADRTALEAAKKVVRSIRRDEQEGLISPSIYDAAGNQLYEFRLVTTAGRRNFDTSEVIERHSRHIAMSALADFIMLGHEEVGSFALSSNKTDMFAIAVSAWLDAVKGVINRVAVPRLFALNTFALEELPTVEPGDLETADLTALGDYITKLAGAGMPLFPNEELEKHLLSQADLPVPEDEL